MPRFLVVMSIICSTNGIICGLLVVAMHFGYL